MWLDFLPESAAFAVRAGGEGGSYSSAPGPEHLSFCFHLRMRGRVGSWGAGRAGRLFCVWLCQAVTPDPRPSPSGLSELPTLLSAFRSL